jgi:hypothetical protein
MSTLKAKNKQVGTESAMRSKGLGEVDAHFVKGDEL